MSNLVSLLAGCPSFDMAECCLHRPTRSRMLHYPLNIALGVEHEPARSCHFCAETIPPPCIRVVAGAGEACAAADDLLLRRIQPDLMDEAPDPGRARGRVQRLFDRDICGAAGRKSGPRHG